MTSEELRDDAICKVAHAIMRYDHDDAYVDGVTFRKYLYMATRAFDALGEAGFPVLGPEVTKEMRAASNTWEYTYIPDDAFMAIVHAGDLTRKPE